MDLQDYSAEEFTLQEFNEEMTLALPDNINHLEN